MAISEMPSLHLEMTRKEFLNRMGKFYPNATARAAIATSLFISDLREKHGNKPLTKQITEQWKIQIDETSKRVLEEELHDMPFVTISVGSEGAKEECHTGTAAPSLQGEYGQRNYGYPEIWKVSDVVEGTHFAAYNLPGASSVITTTRVGGIMPTPEGRKYMMKLIAPPQAKGLISLSQDHEENLRNLIKSFGIAPHELTQVTLNPFDENGKPREGRNINQPFIDAARKLGVNLKLIDAGDFVPGIKAAQDPFKKGWKPMIVIGRSGFEEATMDAAAAKALSGFAEAQEYFVLPRAKDGKFQFELGEFLSIDDMVPADKDEIMVSVSSITGDGNEHFGMPPVEKLLDGRSHKVRTLVITHEGIDPKDIQLAS